MFSRKSFDAESMTEELKPMYERADPAHDFSHIMRVYRNAQIIGKTEGADMQVLLLAALLHDAKPESKSSVKLESQSIKTAEDFLKKKGLPEDVRKRVLYAVEVHRFSKGIVPVTLEARILQDADRLDALGAIGIARVFLTGGLLGRPLYNPVDPFCRSREPDDERWNLDHFFRKLLKLESGMHTDTARKLAARRADVLRRYLSELQMEIGEEISEDFEDIKDYGNDKTKINRTKEFRI